MTEFIHIFNFNLHFHLHFSIRIWVSLIEGSGFCSTDWLSSASKFPSCSNSQVSLLSGERRRKRAPLDNYRSQQSRKSHLNAVSDLSAARWPDSPQWLMKETAERHQHHSHFAAWTPHPHPPTWSLAVLLHGREQLKQWHLKLHSSVLNIKG